METRRFADAIGAEMFLQTDGFVFQGAPSRWRKDAGDETVYADVITVERGAVALLTRKRAAAGWRTIPLP